MKAIHTLEKEEVAEAETENDERNIADDDDDMNEEWGQQGSMTRSFFFLVTLQSMSRVAWQRSRSSKTTSIMNA
jgi:hypothetical protein